MQALMYAVPSLGAIGLGVAIVGLFGRDPHADEHTVDDYRPTLSPSRRDWPLLDRQPGGPRRLRANAAADLPLPSNADLVVPLSAYAECVVAQIARRYGDSPADRAARMLREIADEQREMAGVAR